MSNEGEVEVINLSDEESSEDEDAPFVLERCYHLIPEEELDFTEPEWSASEDETSDGSDSESEPDDTVVDDEYQPTPQVDPDPSGSSSSATTGVGENGNGCQNQNGSRTVPEMSKVEGFGRSDADADSGISDSSVANSENEVIELTNLSEEKLWAVFVLELQTKGALLPEEDEDEDEDFECDYSGDTESDEEADTSDSEMVATCLYREEQDSDEDEDTKVFQTWRKSFAPESTEVITIDDDDDEHFPGGIMQCYRCPESMSMYKDKALFFLHRERHKGKNHFVCPDCFKSFVKISYCFAHEARVHSRTYFPNNPTIQQALDYRKNKEEEAKNFEMEQEPKTNERNSVPFSVDHVDDNTKDENDSIKLTQPGDVLRGEYGVNFSGLILFPEEGTYETDEDDPKFYPDHAVPSTALYPYRGPQPWSMYDCYEIHLRYGRQHRSAVNTISRCAQARIRKLIAEGKIQEEDIGRFYQECKKPAIPVKKKPPASVASQKRKRAVPSTGAPSPCKKRRKLNSAVAVDGDSQIRQFMTGIIHQTCLDCGFAWKNQKHLRAHRDDKHPGVPLLQLLTVPNKEDASSLKKLENEEPVTQQDEFLSNFGLISLKRLEWQKLHPAPAPLRCKLCYVVVNRLPNPRKIPRNGRVFVCGVRGCDYFDRTRDLVKQHKKEAHPKIRLPPASSVASVPVRMPSSGVAAYIRASSSAASCVATFLRK